MPNRATPPGSILLTLLLGCALLYLTGGLVALEAVGIQKLFSLSWVQDSATTSAWVARVPMLNLPMLLLAYLIAKVAFKTADRPGMLHALAFVTPALLQGAWFAVAVGTGSVAETIGSLLATTQEALLWLALLLTVLLALVQVRRRVAA